MKVAASIAFLLEFTSFSLHAHEVQKLRPVTDLSGAVCVHQPTANQVPILEVNGPPGGCTYTKLLSLEDIEGSSHSGSAHWIWLYKKALKQNVRIEVAYPARSRDSSTELRDTLFNGGGVIIGKVCDKIVIATVNHVVHIDLVHPEVVQSDAPHYTVTMPNGGRYPAQLEFFDAANQTAVLSISPGDAKVGSYSVARFAKSTSLNGKGLITGFPSNSSTLYASTVVFKSMRSASESFGNLLKGEDPARPVQEMIGHTADGESGSAVYSRDGLAHGLFEAWTVHPDGTRYVYADPVTQTQVNAWLAAVLLLLHI